MFHVNKKTEYALLALGYLSGKPHEMGSITSVREIAARRIILPRVRFLQVRVVHGLRYS